MCSHEDYDFLNAVRWWVSLPSVSFSWLRSVIWDCYPQSENVRMQKEDKKKCVQFYLIFFIQKDLNHLSLGYIISHWNVFFF